MATKNKDSLFWLGIVTLILGTIGFVISIIPFFGAIALFLEAFFLLVALGGLVAAIITKGRKITLCLSLFPIFIGLIIGLFQFLFLTDLNNIATASENNSTIGEEVRTSYTAHIIGSIKDGVLYVLKGCHNLLHKSDEQIEREFYEKNNSPMDTTNNPFFNNPHDSLVIEN